MTGAVASAALLLAMLLSAPALLGWLHGDLSADQLGTRILLAAGVASAVAIGLRRLVAAYLSSPDHRPAPAHPHRRATDPPAEDPA